MQKYFCDKCNKEIEERKFFDHTGIQLTPVRGSVAKYGGSWTDKKIKVTVGVIDISKNNSADLCENCITNIILP